MPVQADDTKLQKDPDEIRQALAMFTGTATWTKHTFGVLLTEGIKALADMAQCWWLVDIIASYQPEARKKADLRDFQAWRLEMTGPYTCRVFCTDGNDGPPSFEQHIDFTDFPLQEGISIWVESGGPGGSPVMLLPSEH